MIELLAVALAVLGTTLAAWQDWRTSFIDEKITYSMMALGAALTLYSSNVFSAAPDYSLLTIAFGGAAAIFSIGWLMYKTGRLGGGDVLLYTGIHLLIPASPRVLESIALPALLGSEKFLQRAFLLDTGVSTPFILTVFVLSTMLALIGSTVQYTLELRGKKLKPDLPAAGVGMALIIGFAFTMNILGASLTPTLSYSLLLLPAVFLIAFRKQLMDEVIVRPTRIKDIEDEDILVLEKMAAKTVEKYALGPVVTKAELEKLKKIEAREGLHLFPIARVLPRLGPYILAALLLAIFGIDLLTLILAFA